jgi:hypothetical protein
MLYPIELWAQNTLMPYENISAPDPEAQQAAGWAFHLLKSHFIANFTVTVKRDVKFRTGYCGHLNSVVTKTYRAPPHDHGQENHDHGKKPVRWLATRTTSHKASLITRSRSAHEPLNQTAPANRAAPLAARAPEDQPAPHHSAAGHYSPH